VTGYDIMRPQVIVSDAVVTSFDLSHQEVAAEDQKLAYTVHFTSYKAVVCRIRQSRERK